MQTFNPYKGFEGNAEIDTDAQVCRGKILYIDDLVTYKANSPAELVQEFQAAVDDYLATCAQVGKTPQKPCKGQFNVRVTPEQHRQAQGRATRDHTSLNAVVAAALERYLLDPTDEERLIKAAVSSNAENISFNPPQARSANKRSKSQPVTSTGGASPNETLQFNPQQEQPYAH